MTREELGKRFGKPMSLETALRRAATRGCTSYAPEAGFGAGDACYTCGDTKDGHALRVLALTVHELQGLVAELEWAVN